MMKNYESDDSADYKVATTNNSVGNKLLQMICISLLLGFFSHIYYQGTKNTVYRQRIDNLESKLDSMQIIIDSMENKVNLLENNLENR